MVAAGPSDTVPSRLAQLGGGKGRAQSAAAQPPILHSDMAASNAHRNQWVGLPKKADPPREPDVKKVHTQGKWGGGKGGWDLRSQVQETSKTTTARQKTGGWKKTADGRWV